MATTTELHQRVELNLKTISLMLADLPEIAGEWNDISDGERVAWSMDWSNEMSGLEHLARLTSEGLLTVNQLARYQDLVRKIEQALPVLKRLDLYRPSVALRA